jgi:GNAT superfamily N-acetyltransferase
VAGGGVAYRELTPADAPLLDQILEGMSDQSRYRRFHGPKPRLTGKERSYLAAADGRDHLALLALAPSGEPVAVGRVVREREDPERGELAVSVVDAWQRHGIGIELVRRLSRAAAAVGIERIVAVVLTDYWLSSMMQRKGFGVRRPAPGLSTVLELDTASAFPAQRAVEVVGPRAGQLGHDAGRHSRLGAAVN